MLKKLFKELKPVHKILLGILLFVGVFLQSMTMLRSGLTFPFGLGFWGPNGHDGLWHLALVNQVFKGFPPPMPIFSQAFLTNYHYFYDLFLGLIHFLTRIPSINLYFQVFPLLFSFFLGFFSFWVGFKLSKNFWVGFWFAFLNYFAGSLGFLVTFWKNQTIGGESLFWSMQSISTLINPPFAFSLVVILFCLVMLMEIKNYQKWQIILLSLLFGILVNIKIYASILILPGLFLFGLKKWREKEKSPFFIFLFSSAITLVTFFFINRSSSSLLVFEPLWFVHTLIESQDRLYLPKIASARYTFLQGGMYERVILIEIASLGIFLLGNLGTRILGLIPLFKKSLKREFEDLEIFFLTGGILALIIPLLFIQKGTSWNTIQFFYYLLFFLNFYTALFLSRLTLGKKLPLKLFLLIVILLFTLPTTYSTLKDYFGYPPPASLPLSEIQALNFLKKLPGKTVLTYPYSPFTREKFKKEPLPLYAYETTSYVSAFSEKLVFLEDEMNLSILGYPWEERRQEEERFFTPVLRMEGRGFLLQNQIDYLYLLEGQDLPLSENDLGVRQIYRLDNIRIYEVLR